MPPTPFGYKTALAALNFAWDKLKLNASVYSGWSTALGDVCQEAKQAENKDADLAKILWQNLVPLAQKDFDYNITYVAAPIHLLREGAPQLEHFAPIFTPPEVSHLRTGIEDVGTGVDVFALAFTRAAHGLSDIMDRDCTGATVLAGAATTVGTAENHMTSGFYLLNKLS
jgi:hypothetical protein